MANRDIPIAYGIPMSPPSIYDNASSSKRPDLQSATVSNGGRSSRVMMPTGNQELAELSERTIQSLLEQGYTRGLAEYLRKNKLAHPLAIWVVDNSGSMQTNDGHKIFLSSQQRMKGELKFVPCSRWAEMQQTVEYHAQLCALLQSPTVFRLLNDPGRIVGQQQFSIAERGPAFIDQDLAIAQQTILNTCPGGVTPLIPHLQEIRDNVLALEPTLRRDGTKVVLVLATDGLPTDERGLSDDLVKRRFVEALRALEGLPIWIVVRLCTDEEEVVRFWNSLDDQLELSLDVLDDFVAEAAEVHEKNKWLNYGLPLHRMREMGFYHRSFDLLDERKLYKGELRDFFRILLGDGALDGIADPEGDWKRFFNQLSLMVQKEKNVWNPITKRLEPWVNLKCLDKEYGNHGWFW